MTADEPSYDCVMPAAGSSTRMGKWKLMLPIEGVPLVERSVENALAECARVILVTGHRANELAELFAGNPRVVIVYNPDYAAGMFSSIRAGVRAVASERFFITLADMPFIPPGTFGLLAAMREPLETGGAARPICQSRPGHPVLLPRAAIDKILQFDNAHSMKEVLQGLPLSPLPTDDDGVLSDIDDPADYRRATDRG